MLVGIYTAVEARASRKDTVVVWFNAEEIGNFIASYSISERPPRTGAVGYVKPARLIQTRVGQISHPRLDGGFSSGHTRSISIFSRVGFCDPSFIPRGFGFSSRMYPY